MADIWDKVASVGIPALTIVGGWIAAVLHLRNDVSKLKKDHSDHLEKDHPRERKEMDECVRSLRIELDKMREQIEELRNSAGDYARDEELARYIISEQERWERMQRALGTIEGYLELGKKTRNQ